MEWYRNSSCYLTEYIREDLRFKIVFRGAGSYQLHRLPRDAQGRIGNPELVGKFPTLKAAKEAAV